MILIFGLIMTGCSLGQDDTDIRKTINEDTWEISVKASESVQYRYQLMKAFPVEGGPQITSEPDHAEVSEISYEEDGIYYLYQPKANFTGTDKVVITNNISAGGTEIVAQNILKLTIRVHE